MSNKVGTHASTALLDLDGTVAGFDESMRRKLEAMRSPGEPIIVEADYDLPHITERRRLIKSQPGFWRGLPRIELGFQIVEALKRLNFEIQVLTKGPMKTPNAWSEKLEWAQEHLPGIPVTIAQDKSKVYSRVLVDDWVEYVVPWLTVRPRGLVVMVAQPWNTKERFEHPRAIRYDGSNYEEVIDRLAKARALDA